MIICHCNDLLQQINAFPLFILIKKLLKLDKNEILRFTTVKCGYHCDTKSTKSKEKTLRGNCGGSCKQTAIIKYVSLKIV